MRMKGNPENAFHVIFLLFSVCRGEIYKSLSHILTDLKEKACDASYRKIYKWRTIVQICQNVRLLVLLNAIHDSYIKSHGFHITLKSSSIVSGDTKFA